LSICSSSHSAALFLFRYRSWFFAARERMKKKRRSLVVF
jgi:hypothetical protein